MCKKILGAVSVFILAFAFFFTSNVSAAPAQTKRLGGKNRYETCSEIVNEGWKTSEYAVIVNGENFPDALSASTLAKKYNAPILLTLDNALDDNAAFQLKRLGVKKVFIVGGSSVVKSNVEADISNLGISIERFSGKDRNATSVAVAKQIGTENGIILTTDSDFTDALSVSPIAAKLQMPIILMPKDSIPSSVSSFISGKNISKTYVLGESDLISDSVVAKFPNRERIPGKDKYERNINIMNAFSDKIDFSSSCLAYSEKFADALSGSAFAALKGNPIILVGDKPYTATKHFILNKNLSNINILGGTAGITPSNLDSLLEGGYQTSNNSLSIGMKFPENSDYVIADVKTGDVNGDGVKENVILTYNNNIKDSSNNFKGCLYIQDSKNKNTLAYKYLGEDLYINHSKILLGDMDGDKISDIIIVSEYGGTSRMQSCDIETLKNNKLISLGKSSGEHSDFVIPEDSIKFSLDGWDKLNLDFTKFKKSYSVDLTNDNGMQSAKTQSKKVDPYIGHGPRFSIADIDRDGVYEIGVYFDISGSYHADCLVGFNNYYKLNNYSWKLVDSKIHEIYPVKENMKDSIKDNNNLSNKITEKQAYNILISIAKPEEGFRFDSLGFNIVPYRSYIPSELRGKKAYAFMEINDYIQVSQYYVTEDGGVYKDTVSIDNTCKKIN